jgi:hypothetical protein
MNKVVQVSWQDAFIFRELEAIILGAYCNEFVAAQADLGSNTLLWGWYEFLHSM